MNLKEATSVVELGHSLHCGRVSELLEQPINATELFCAQQQPSNMSHFFQQLMDWAVNNDMVVNF